jgi:hypothetical protein
VQPSKQEGPMRSTDAGIKIRLKAIQPQNANLPISSSVLLDSNVTLLRDVHEEKQFGPRIVTTDGIQIDASE